MKKQYSKDFEAHLKKVNSGTAEAIEFAREVHKGEKYGAHEYMKHLIDCYFFSTKYTEDPLISIACLLHDTVESDKNILSIIRSKFGDEVADIVWAVTDEEGKTRKEKKAKTYPKIKANKKAVIVKLIDRISNVSNTFEHKNDSLKQGVYGTMPLYSYGISNVKLFKMYVQEHGDFEKSLKPEDPNETELRLWMLLNGLISIGSYVLRMSEQKLVGLK